MSGNGKQPEGTESAPAIEIEAEAPPAPASSAPTEEFKEQVTQPTEAVPALMGQVEVLQKEKKDYYERLLRTAADFENFKKRSRKEVGEAEERGIKSFIKELLPVIDNLERAVAHEGASEKSSSGVVEGVRLVLRQLYGVLERFEVQAFASVRDPFDPQMHEAISQAETNEQPPGTIVSEMHKGYTMKGRLLRPAMVVVAKAAPKPVAKGDPDPTPAGGVSSVDGEAAAPPAAKDPAETKSDVEGAGADTSESKGT